MQRYSFLRSIKSQQILQIYLYLKYFQCIINYVYSIKAMVNYLFRLETISPSFGLRESFTSELTILKIKTYQNKAPIR